MRVPKVLLLPQQIMIFGRKRPNLANNWHFWSFAGLFGALLVGWLVVVARAVSCKTPIYFIIYIDIAGLIFWLCAQNIIR